ncbi:MAG: RdgB/HAM1 family non-canonical purine NTP pyrophosphatase [Oscillospiraceae bacterium]|nr:RdgB/HAM1 family non-canonical purine NTP pyrophosphatase [Oscillospiraceae bacterium]
MKIIVASKNLGKIQEYGQMLAPLGFEVVSASDVGISAEVSEDGATFEENARIKARAVYERSEGLRPRGVLADDSGLEVDYLGGEPGVFSARYAPAGQRRKTVLDRLNGVPVENRTARFVCCVCYIGENGGEIAVRGECEGYIGFENRGENGFGYDPIFMAGEKSFAEMSDTEKNAVSHRGAALRKLMGALNDNG